jgi:hypothetical protein
MVSPPIGSSRQWPRWRPPRHCVRLFRNCPHLPSLFLSVSLSPHPAYALTRPLRTSRLVSDHRFRFALVAARAMSTQIPKTMKAVQVGVGGVVPADAPRSIIPRCSLRVCIGRSPRPDSDASAWRAGRSLNPLPGAEDGRARGAHPRGDPGADAERPRSVDQGELDVSAAATLVDPVL